MQPIQIFINDQLVEVLSPLPEKITSFSVLIMPFHIPITKSAIIPVKQWLNTLIDRLDTEHVVYNNTFIETKDLRRFDDI